MLINKLTHKFFLKFSLFFYSTLFIFQFTYGQTIMLNPAGHAKDTGRKLTNNYERAETLKLAETLQHVLQERSNTRVLLTRSPGEEIVHLQNASFANRLNIDFFISIHMYKEDTEKPKLSGFYLTYDSVADSAPYNKQVLSFIPIHHAHRLSIHKTKHWAQIIKTILTNPENQKQFDFTGFHGIPLKPLAGITAPALLFDIGINNDDQWHDLVPALTQSLLTLTNNTQGTPTITIQTTQAPQDSQASQEQPAPSTTNQTDNQQDNHQQSAPTDQPEPPGLL